MRGFFLTFFVFFLPLVSQTYDLSICAIFQNEAPYLKEWIEFHKLVGVEHFYLFNNLSQDDPKEVLLPYLQSGEVTLLDWPPSGCEENWGWTQASAYNHCLQLAREETKWLAVIDIDEFIVPTQTSNLIDFLRPFEKNENIAGVCINWQLYGTSSVSRLKEGELLVEKLTLKGPSEYELNDHIKSIIRPQFAISAATPHAFKYQQDYYAVDPNGRRVSGPFNPDIPINAIRINHYWLRTKEFAYGEKFERLKKRISQREGCVDEDVLLVWIEAVDEETSQEEDLAVFPYLPMLREAMLDSKERGEWL